MAHPLAAVSPPSRIPLLLTCAIGLACWHVQEATAADLPTRPNVVFVISDDQGWADMGYHGSDVLTPNLDRLAAGGVRLNQNYVYPTCSPTRAAVLSGRNPSRFRIYGPIAGRSTHALPTDIVTLPKALRERGYYTAISGKWHLGLRPEVGPLKYGFISSYGYLHGQCDPYTHLYKIGDPSWHRNDKLITEKGHATDLITDEAVRIIKESRSRPFFLYVAYSVPHYPLDEPAKWLDMYEGKIKDPSRRLFAASLTHMDDGIGRIIKALDEAGHREKTLFIYTSDNGGQKSWSSKTQYKGRYADKPHKVLGNNKPLRGWKGELYEGGVRVPALANWPGVLKPRGVETPVHVMDWLPTLVNLAGGEVNKKDKLEGVDIWPVLNGQPLEKKRTLYWNTGGRYAVRHGDLKMIKHRDGRIELFNLAKDPHEEKDLSRTQTAGVALMESLLAVQRYDDPDSKKKPK